MKYARNVGGEYRDYTAIPQPWPEGYWTNDPVEFCEKMFPDTTGWEQVADDAGSVPAPPVVPPPLSWNAYEFKARFTQAERILIRNAAKQSDALFDFQDMLDTAGFSGVPVVADNAELLAGLQALVDATILTADRRDAILGVGNG